MKQTYEQAFASFIQSVSGVQDAHADYAGKAKDLVPFLKTSLPRRIEVANAIAAKHDCTMRESQRERTGLGKLTFAGDRAKEAVNKWDYLMKVAGIAKPAKPQTSTDVVTRLARAWAKLTPAQRKAFAKAIA